MNKIVLNPYYDLRIDDVPENIRPRGEWELKYDKISSQEKITLQTYLEIVHNQPEGTYSPVCTAPPMSKMKPLSRDQQATYLEDYGKRLVDGTNVIESGSQDGDLALLVVENHPKIAKSLDQANIDHHRFYISNVEEEKMEETRANDRYMELVAAGSDVINNMKPFIAYQIGIVLRIFKDKPTMSTIRKSLQDYVTKQTQTQFGSVDERYTDFMKVYKLAKGDQEERARLYITYLIQQAENSSVFHISDGRYIWVKQRENRNWYNLGTSIQTIIDRFVREYMVYDPEVTPENFFAYLEDEVAAKGLEVEDRS
jgi:hypothetical protein